MLYRLLGRCICVIIITVPNIVFAQGTLQDYQKAESYLPQNIVKLVLNAQLRANWLEKSSTFWYRKEISGGKEFILIDAENNTSIPAFDHNKLASTLSQEMGKTYDAQNLPFNSIKFIDENKTIQFDVDSLRWICDLENYSLKKIEQTDPPRGKSPDGKWQASIKEYNLFVKNLETNEEIQLTDDGIERYDYAFRPRWGQLTNESEPKEQVAPSRVNVTWSPDSKKLVTFRMDRRKEQKLYLYQSMPEKGMRAQVLSYERALPGDTLLAMVEFFIFDIEKRTKIPVDLPPSPAFLSWNPWFKDNNSLYYYKWYRGYHALDLLEIDATTGKTKIFLEERSETNVNMDMFALHKMEDGKQLIWASERDGWNHLYLYDAHSRILKNQITKGEFVVFDIGWVNEKEHIIYFTAGGREQGRDPYYPHLYKVNFDGSGLQLLTPEDAYHSISFAPTGKYFVDNYSRVDLATESVLRRTEDGKIIRVLEEADISKLLATNWKHPERFSVKARDGKTDIYGVIFKPSNFDPSKKYPVIDATYSGPQAVRTPKTFRRGFRNSDQSIAELGFIVVTIDGMGTANRSKAFHNVSYANLGDIGAPDHIAGLKQLAKRYSYMDLSRVGIYGHSAGGYDAAHAVLKYPDFYKVAVASAGNHDHRMAKVWWPEFWMGELGDHYEEQSNLTIAGNLQGKLLLVHGDLDNNVNPASTLRLAGELIKANKDFDILIIPNKYHGFGDHRYFIRKRWDYFVKHLLGVEPPKEYEIKPFNSDE